MGNLDGLAQHHLPPPRHAVNGLAHWLVSKLGPARAGDELEVLTYIGTNDVRYIVMLLAALKTGRVVCFRRTLHVYE